MLRSVRVRIALLFAGAFAVFLTAFAVTAYAFMRAATLARIDEFLEETGVAVAGAIDFRRSSGSSDTAAVVSVLQEYRFRDIDVFVLDRTTGMLVNARAGVDTTAIAARTITAVRPRDVRAMLEDAPLDELSIETVVGPRGRVRLLTLPHPLTDRIAIVATLQPLRAHEKSLFEAELGLLFGLPVLIAASTAAGFVLARKSLLPVSVMTDRAATISATNLHARLPVPRQRDELGRLALVFNDLLDRLEGAFEDQRRFMADASHELRTPVAVISGESELALARTGRSASELRDALGVIREESRRLAEIVNDLFLLARTDAGQRVSQTQDLYLADLVEECVRAARTLAATRQVTVDMEATPGDLPIRGDEGLLRRLVMNLLDNAVKHTPVRSRILVSLARDDGRYIIDVTDGGPGIPASEQPFIFERFYRARADTSEAKGDGAGLGLAIARGIARAHGGDVTLVRSDADGSVFRVSLSANPEPPSEARVDPER
jgi:two-component system OmpR family sensor kinase